MNKIYRVNWVSEVKYRMTVFAEDEEAAEDLILCGDFNISDADILSEDVISVDVFSDN